MNNEGGQEMAVTENQLPMMDEAAGNQDDALRVVRVSGGKVVNASTLAQQGVAKLRAIEKELNDQFAERADVIKAMILAVMSGEHVFMYGPPGTAKSLLANSVAKHIDAGTFFSYLLNKTTDPAELLGPYSVKAMEKDHFLRKPDGRLPDAVLAFIDEIWKCNNPTLNIMLPILNERIFFNDGKVQPIPLITMVCASNEFPEDDSLKAIWDRIMFRVDVGYVKDPNNLFLMLKSDVERRNSTISTRFNRTIITLDEIKAIHQTVNDLPFPEGAIKSLGKLKMALESKGLTLSDRRWANCLKIMQANALYQGRKKVSSDDLEGLKQCLWEKLDDISMIDGEIGKLMNPYAQELKDLMAKVQQVKTDTMNLTGPARASAAVEAKMTFDQLTAKVDKIIEDADSEGRDTTAMIQQKAQMEAVKQEILEACLGIGKKAPAKPKANEKVNLETVAKEDEDMPF